MEEKKTIGGGSSGSPLRSLSDRINKYSEILLFILMITMIIITTMQVVFRFFFEALIWSEEITRFLLVFASLVGAAVAFKRGSHISITFFVNKLPSLLNKIIAISVQILGILFFVIMAWYGGIMMISEASQSTPALGFSMLWIYLMYPVMGCVILIHLLDGLYDVIRRN